MRGFYKTTYEGRAIAAFQGIPYAQSPVGELRFEVRFFQIQPLGEVIRNKRMFSFLKVI